MNLIRSSAVRALVRPTIRLRPPTRTINARRLHITDVLYKNKQANHSVDAESFDEDLFATPGEVQAETKLNHSTVEPTGSAEKLEARRSERFKLTKISIIKHPAFVFAYARLNPEKADNSHLLDSRIPIRRLKRMRGPKRALLVKMITIAATRAELLEFIDIFKTYRQVGWFIDDLARLDFIGRCIHLKAPDIALAILYHRPVFGFDIPSLTSARALMRSLLSTPHPPPDADIAPLPEDMRLPTETPLAHALLLANLFDVYALPPAETDPVSRALLLGAGAELLKAGTDTEEANAIIQLVRESAENQTAQLKGPVLNGKDPRVKDGKLVATSQALKERGKFTSQAAQLRTNSLYNDELTASERTWIERRLNNFVTWAQEQNQDTSWVDKLKIA